MDNFLKKLASEESVPGGGSAAALAGAIGAALLAMVAKLSKEDPEAVKISLEAENLMGECSRLAKEDEEAFREVAEAYQLSKKTEEEKKVRSIKIQESLKKATVVPIHSAQTALRLLHLVEEFLPKSNRNALSDIGVAAILAEAACGGAALNVLINLVSVKDKNFSKSNLEKIQAFMEEGKKLRSRVLEHVHQTLKQSLEKSLSS